MAPPSSSRDAGDQANAITLPAPPQVGQAAQTAMAIDMDLAVDDGGNSTEVAVGLAMDLTTEVTEVSADGGYVTVPTLDAVGDHRRARRCRRVGRCPVSASTACNSSRHSTPPATRCPWNPSGPGSAGAERRVSSSSRRHSRRRRSSSPPSRSGPERRGRQISWSRTRASSSPSATTTPSPTSSNGRYTIEATLDSEFDISQGGVDVTGTMAGPGRRPVRSTTRWTSRRRSTCVGHGVDVDGMDMSMSMDMNIEMGTTPSREPVGRSLQLCCNVPSPCHEVGRPAAG